MIDKLLSKLENTIEYEIEHHSITDDNLLNATDLVELKVILKYCNKELNLDKYL